MFVKTKDGEAKGIVLDVVLSNLGHCMSNTMDVAFLENLKEIEKDTKSLFSDFVSDKNLSEIKLYAENNANNVSQACTKNDYKIHSWRLMHCVNMVVYLNEVFDIKIDLLQTRKEQKVIEFYKSFFLASKI